MHEKERYQIEGRIGEGGRGAVYRARDLQLDRKVAIKRLFANGKESDSMDEVLKESRALSAINSPHIVRVFDVDRDRDGPFVVMELLEGKTLHDVVSAAPLLREDFLKVAEQSLEALLAAHQSKILHRDIKPGNLMLTWLPSGRLQLKLLDFGLAKFTEQPSLQTMAHEGSVLGSIYFMAPEQFDRKPLDARTDLYSLGCVFYYALTGQFPFTGDTSTEVMASHIRGDCPDLQPLRPDLAPALCQWVMILLSRDMEDRPASAREALATLEKAKLATAPVGVANHAPNRPRLLTGAEAESGSQPITLTSATGSQPVGLLATATSPVSATPGQPRQRAWLSTIPPWAIATAGFLLISIVALGVAMAMRGDPGKTVTRPLPEPAAPAEQSATPANEPLPSPAPKEERDPKSIPITTDQPAEPRWNATREFRKADANGDFRIDRREFVSAATEPQKTELGRRFVELDQDQNGWLSMSEFKKQHPDG